MLNPGRTGAEGVGLAGRVLSLTQVRLLTVLAAATLTLFLFAVGDNATAHAAGKPPAPQAAATAPDNCGYSSFMPGYGFGSGFGYGFGYMGAPWWYQPAVCVPVVPMVSYSTCTPLPGVYNCSGYCGSGYWFLTNCAPACPYYSCAPYCVQAYSAFQYGFGYGFGFGYGTVPCQLAVDRVAFVDAPNSVNCGTSWDLVVQVWDALGHAVVDGTQVKFATSLGSVTASASTTGGKAVTRLVNAPGRSGLAQVTAQAGNVEGSAIIMVKC